MVKSTDTFCVSTFKRTRLKVLTLLELHCRNFNCAWLRYISVLCRSSTAVGLINNYRLCFHWNVALSENLTPSCQAEEGTFGVRGKASGRWAARKSSRAEQWRSQEGERAQFVASLRRQVSGLWSPVYLPVSSLLSIISSRPPRTPEFLSFLPNSG